MGKTSCLVGLHLNKSPSSQSRQFSIALTFDVNNPNHNLKVMERYSNAIQKFNKPLLEMLMHDSKCLRSEMLYFDKRYFRRVPTLILYKKQAKLVPDYAEEIKKIEDEIFRTRSLTNMIDISDKEELDKNDKLRFAMKKEIRNSLEENVVVEAVKDDTGTKFLQMIESMGVGMMSEIKKNVIEVRANGKPKQLDGSTGDPFE